MYCCGTKDKECYLLNLPKRITHFLIKYFFYTPNKCTYLFQYKFLSHLSYMFRCILYTPSSEKNSYYLHKTVCFVFCVVRNSYTQSVGKMQNLFNVQAGGLYTVELGYDAVGLCDTSAIALHILWYQQFPHKARDFLHRLVRHTVDHLPRL